MDHKDASGNSLFLKVVNNMITSYTHLIGVATWITKIRMKMCSENLSHVEIAQLTQVTESSKKVLLIILKINYMLNQLICSAVMTNSDNISTPIFTECNIVSNKPTWLMDVLAFQEKAIWLIKMTQFHYPKNYSTKPPKFAIYALKDLH